MPRTVPYDFQSLSIGQLYTGQWHDFRALSADPVAPPSGYGRLYSLDNAGDEELWWQLSDGTKVLLTPGGGPAPANAQFLVMEPNASLPNAFNVGFSTVPTPLQDAVSFTFDPLVTPGVVFIAGGATAAQLTIRDDSDNTVASIGVSNGIVGDQSDAEGRITLYSTDDNITYYRRFLASYNYASEGGGVGRLQLNSQHEALRLEGVADDVTPEVSWTLYSPLDDLGTEMLGFITDGSNSNIQFLGGVANNQSEIVGSTTGLNIELNTNPSDGQSFQVSLDNTFSFLTLEDDDFGIHFQVYLGSGTTLLLQDDVTATKFDVELDSNHTYMILHGGDSRYFNLYLDADTNLNRIEFSTGIGASTFALTVNGAFGANFTVTDSFNGNERFIALVLDNPGAALILRNDNIDQSLRVTIGDTAFTLIDGDGVNLDIGAGNALTIANLPTADPALSNQVWNNMGVLMKDAA